MFEPGELCARNYNDNNHMKITQLVRELRPGVMQSSGHARGIFSKSVWVCGAGLPTANQRFFHLVTSHVGGA